jgi:hypothetical protein
MDHIWFPSLCTANSRGYTNDLGFAMLAAEFSRHPLLRGRNWLMPEMETEVSSDLMKLVMGTAPVKLANGNWVSHNAYNAIMITQAWLEKQEKDEKDIFPLQSHEKVMVEGVGKRSGAASMVTQEVPNKRRRC